MVDDLKKFIHENKVIFGIRQNMKNSKKIDKVFVPIDAREETIEALKGKNIAIDFVDMPKQEISDKLELNFFCEVFGVKK